nr:hypothetical protein [Tanacetum cinerariifolium]
FAGAVASIPRIVQRYMDQRMNETVKVAIQIQSDRLRDEAQAKNEDFLKNLDENIQKIIKEQEKATKTTGKSNQGSKSHQKIASESAPAEEPMQTTKDLEEPSHQEFETGAADNQPITEASQHPEWFRQQKKPPTPDPFLMNRLKVDTLNLELLVGPTYELMKGSCKSLVELEFFLEENCHSKRRRDDDEDKDEEPSAGPDQGSKRRREGKEPESSSTPSDTTTKSADRSTTGSRSRLASASESAFAEEPV